MDVRLVGTDAGTIVDVRHRDIPAPGPAGMGAYAFEDVWFLSLENLRRHLAGQDVVRCDFTRTYAVEIEHTVEIGGPPAEVWDALITPSQLERWIASTATVDLRVGGTYDLGWGEWSRLEILALAPGRELALRWEVEGRPTVVTWTLEGSGGRTRLTIVHSGFAPDERVDGLGVAGCTTCCGSSRSWRWGTSGIRPSRSCRGTSIWAAQDELLERGDADAEVV